ncbi:MAG: glycosyltransferase [Proteobacteria bacterium]|nr:glycosyltransferase [Pseudomonadota bacterium]
MKIMFFITGLTMGGAETQVCALADSFSSRGYQVIIVALTGKAVILPSEKNIQVELLGMKKSIYGLIKGFFQARELIKVYQPDVVHSHMVHANIFTRILRSVIEIKCLINTAHSTNEGGKARQFLYRITDFLTDLSTNVSDEAVRAFVKNKSVPEGRMISVCNGVNTEKFHFFQEIRDRVRKEFDIDENCKLLLAVGRLAVEKDYPNLLKSICIVKKSDIKFKLIIVGSGELKSVLQELSVELGLSSHISFVGERRDVAELMSASDLFVLSSEWEGFGLVVAEAMSCERLVVATDCGGVSEVLGDSRFLVPPQSSQDLAAGIIAALALDCAEKEFIEKSSRERIIKNFSIDAITSRWLGIYLEYLK